MGRSLGGECYSDAKQWVLRWHLKNPGGDVTSIAVGIWFQMCGEWEKTRCQKSVFILGTCRTWKHHVFTYTLTPEKRCFDTVRRASGLRNFCYQSLWDNAKVVSVSWQDTARCTIWVQRSASPVSMLRIRMTIDWELPGFQCCALNCTALYINVNTMYNCTLAYVIHIGLLYYTYVLIYCNMIFKNRCKKMPVLTARRRRIRPSSWAMSSRRLDCSPAIRRSSSSRRCRRPRSSAIRTGLRVDTPATPPRLRATCACFSCSSRRRRISHIISLKIHTCKTCQVNKIKINVTTIRLSKWCHCMSTVQMSEESESGQESEKRCDLRQQQKMKREGQQWYVIDFSSTDEWLQQETLCRWQWTDKCVECPKTLMRQNVVVTWLQCMLVDVVHHIGMLVPHHVDIWSSKQLTNWKQIVRGRKICVRLISFTTWKWPQQAVNVHVSTQQSKWVTWR